MKLSQVLELRSLSGTRVVAGASALDRDVRAIHAIDIPEPSLYVTAGQVLLTTGYSWPRDTRAQERQLALLSERGLVGLGLAVPHFFKSFPKKMRTYANGLGLALLEIPWSVPFAEIVEDVHRTILIEQFRMIELGERIHRELMQAMSRGATFPELADVLSSLIRRPVIFEDSDGNVLAATRMETAESSGRREYSCPIQLPGRVVGRVRVMEGAAPLSELDYRAAEYASLVAALKFAHERELSNLEDRLGNAFVATLLDGTFEATPQSLERARLMGIEAERLYVVILFVLSEAVPINRDTFSRRETVVHELRRQLGKRGVPPLISAAQNQVAVVTPQGSLDDCPFAVENDTAVVVGPPRMGLAGIRESYLSATELIPFSKPGLVRCFDEMLLPRVILGDERARTQFMNQIFARLENGGQGDQLKATLHAFVRFGFRIDETAKHLKVHPNTVRYRLDRVSETLEQRLDDPEVRFQLQLAVRLLDSVHNRDGLTL